MEFVSLCILIVIAGLLAAAAADSAKAGSRLIRADIAAQSAMQQHRYDDLVGLCERMESMLEALQKNGLKPVAGKAKVADLMRVMDYETSQIAALDEFKEQ